VAAATAAGGSMDAALRQKTCHTCHQLFAICVRAPAAADRRAV